MTRREGIRRNARAFCIWREASSVGWECTAPELADATGLSVRVVRSICRERGWTIQPDNEADEIANSSVIWVMSRQRADHARGVQYFGRS